MAFLRIDSGPIEATDKLREVPKEKWRDLMVARRLHMKTKLAYDCRCLVEFVDDAEQMHEVLGYPNAEAMVREGYELKPEEIDVAIRWLRINPPKEALPLDQATRLGTREIGIKGGKPGPGRGHKTDSNATRLGRGYDYYLARLDRDGKTELAAKVRSGERSANSVAIELGWRKKKRCPKCGHEW